MLLFPTTRRESELVSSYNNAKEIPLLSCWIDAFFKEKKIFGKNIYEV